MPVYMKCSDNINSVREYKGYEKQFLLAPDSFINGMSGIEASLTSNAKNNFFIAVPFIVELFIDSNTNNAQAAVASDDATLAQVALNNKIVKEVTITQTKIEENKEIVIATYTIKKVKFNKRFSMQFELELYTYFKYVPTPTNADGLAVAANPIFFDLDAHDWSGKQ